MKQLLKYTLLWVIGGIIYYCLELLWRGYSHFSMFILGGICFIALGLINELFTFQMPLWKQMFIGALIITALEFITGLIVNVWLGWNVWDYSDLPLNILGQICIPFMVLWFFISLIGIVLDDYLRYWLFKEEKPHYVLFKKGN